MEYLSEQISFQILSHECRMECYYNVLQIFGPCTEQESIPVGWVLTAWKPYLLQFQWPAPDVT